MSDGPETNNTDTSRIPRSKISLKKPTAAPHVPINVQKEDQGASDSPAPAGATRLVRPLAPNKPEAGQTSKVQFTKDDAVGTNTVQLKVIKEDRQSLARPTAAPKAVPTPATPAATSSNTIKLRPPSATRQAPTENGEVSTNTAPLPTSAAAASTDTQPLGTAAATAKVMPKPVAKPAQTTVKLKAAPTKPQSKTVSMKAPGGKPSFKAPNGASKPATPKAAAAPAPAAFTTDEDEGKPGILFTLFDMATVACLGFVIYLTVNNLGTVKSLIDSIYG